MGKGPMYYGHEVKELGNFYMTQFYVDGVCFHSSEQYYQYCKNSAHREAILAAPTPQDAWKIGQRKTEMASNWPIIQEYVMYRGVLAKFSQNLGLSLVLTGLNLDKLVFCENAVPDAWDKANERIIRRVHGALINQKNLV